MNLQFRKLATPHNKTNAQSNKPEQTLTQEQKVNQENLKRIKQRKY